MPFIVFGKIVCTGLSVKWKKKPTIALIGATFNDAVSPVSYPSWLLFISAPPMSSGSAECHYIAL
jgi:hypothetical protein